MSPEADSAGVPFAGRSFTPNPFAGDSGESDPELLRARVHLQSLRESPAPQRNLGAKAQAWKDCVEAFRSARLLSPLIAEAGDFGVTDAGAVVEKTQELSIPHLEGPEGRVVAPIFADIAALTAWNASARPTPVEGQRAALAAASEGLALMVLDPGSPNSLGFRRGAIRAIATGERYRVPWHDEEIRALVGAVLGEHSSLIPQHRVIAGDPGHSLVGPELVVVLGVRPGLEREKLRALVANISEQLAADEVMAQLCDGLGVKVIPA